MEPGLRVAVVEHHGTASSPEQSPSGVTACLTVVSLRFHHSHPTAALCQLSNVPRPDSQQFGTVPLGPENQALPKHYGMMDLRLNRTPLWKPTPAGGPVGLPVRSAIRVTRSVVSIRPRFPSAVV